MDHLAIMRPDWGFIKKILAGTKTIESRWYMHRRAPWGKVAAGDTVYFKNSSQPVTAKAVVQKVVYLEGLTPERIKEVLAIYGSAIGIPAKNQAAFFRHIKDKRYGILIWLQGPRPVEPFIISKDGFGAMAAWISVKDLKNRCTIGVN